MSLFQRLKPAASAAFKHLLACLLVAALVASLVFGLWYPRPYGELAGGQNLLLLLVAVDVVCGPLLTLVIYDPKKPHSELVRDIGLVVLIQLAALGYGLHSLMQARPVWLAFEGDRYRVVSVPDIMPGQLTNAAPALQRLSLSGPRPLGVRLAEPTDPDFLQSVQRSMAGDHPAFRPERWTPYDQQHDAVRAALKPLVYLGTRHPGQQPLIDRTVQQHGGQAQNLGFLPLMAENRSDWVVVVDRQTAMPVDYLPLDGWDD